jgi:hypothetical protein
MGKRIVLLGLAVCLSVPLSALAGGRKPIVAVFEIQPRGLDLNRDLLRSLTEYLGTALSEGGSYRVVPLGDIRRALTSKARESYKKCYDKQCQIELGRELAANKTISSSILKIGKSCVVTCSVYDLKTQTAELSAKVEGRCGADALLASLREVARKVCAKKTGQGSEASKLNEILKRTKTKVAERERAKEAWALISKVARDEATPVGERAEAVRAYMQEFGKKNPRYQEAAQLLAKIPAAVRITSDPPGAVIAIDGSYKGTTPLALTVGAGEHEVEASKDGCFSAKKSLSVEPGDETSLEIAFERAATVVASSKPAGARLRVDGEAAGRTPVRLKLHAGEHRLVVSLPGYEVEKRTVEVEPGAVAEQYIELQALPKGELAVRTEPAGARVLVDGEEVGTAPLERELAPGFHEIGVAHQGYVTEQRMVQLASGERTDLDLRLEAVPPSYTSWGHVTFWSGLGLAALGSVSAYMAASLGDEANSKASNSLRDKSIAWEGAMWAFLPAGGALMVSGIVLWALSPDEDLDELPGVSVTPGPDGGLSLSLCGRF